MIALLFLSVATCAEEMPANQFVQVDRRETGGHFFSQVIYAPSADAFVSWGTQTHHHKIRTHETRHFLPGRNQWIDAFPPEKAKGEIRVELWTAEDDQIHLKVSDNGRGLPPELDVEHAQSLGLRLVNMLTQQLRGRLEVQKNGGTSFQVIFPRAE